MVYKKCLPYFFDPPPSFIVYGFSILKWVYFEISFKRISFSGICSSLTRLFQKYQTFLIYFDPPLFMISLLFHLFCTIHGFSLTWTGQCSWIHINNPFPTQFSVLFQFLFLPNLLNRPPPLFNMTLPVYDLLVFTRSSSLKSMNKAQTP